MGDDGGAWEGDGGGRGTGESGKGARGELDEWRGREAGAAVGVDDVGKVEGNEDRRGGVGSTNEEGRAVAGGGGRVEENECRAWGGGGAVPVGGGSEETCGERRVAPSVMVERRVEILDAKASWYRRARDKCS